MRLIFITVIVKLWQHDLTNPQRSVSTNNLEMIVMMRLMFGIMVVIKIIGQDR